jgi:hypothetical protein
LCPTTTLRSRASLRAILRDEVRETVDGRGAPDARAYERSPRADVRMCMGPHECRQTGATSSPTRLPARAIAQREKRAARARGAGAGCPHDQKTPSPPASHARRRARALPRAPMRRLPADSRVAASACASERGAAARRRGRRAGHSGDGVGAGRARSPFERLRRVRLVGCRAVRLGVASLRSRSPYAQLAPSAPLEVRVSRTKEVPYAACEGHEPPISVLPSSLQPARPSPQPRPRPRPPRHPRSRIRLARLVSAGDGAGAGSCEYVKSLIRAGGQIRGRPSGPVGVWSDLPGARVRRGILSRTRSAAPSRATTAPKCAPSPAASSSRRERHGQAQPKWRQTR